MRPVIKADTVNDAIGKLPDIPYILIEIFARALTVAEAAGVAEIGIDQLLAALSPMSTEAGSPGSSGEHFHPVPRREMVFSTGAKEVLNAIRSHEGLTVDIFRTALLEAKLRGLE